MPTRTPRTAAILLAPVFALVSLFSAGIGRAAPPPDVSEIVPARTMVVVSIPNFKALSDSFGKTELGKLWEEPAVKAFLEEAAADFSKSFSDLLKDINADAKDVHPPQGQVGFALFLPDKPKGGGDDAGGKPANTEPYMLATADMGEHAAEWDGLLEKLFEKGTREKKLTTERDTYQGVDVTIIKPLIDEEALKRRTHEREGEGEEGEEGPPPTPELVSLLGGTLDDRRDLRLGRVGTVFVASTEQRAFEDAVDALKGKRIDSLADAPGYRASIDQHPQGLLASGAVMLEPVWKMLESEPADPFAPAITRFMSVLGFSGVKSASVGLRLDTQDGMVDVSFGAVVPEKTGLLEMISAAPAASFDPPAFIPADAAGVSRMSFDFSNLFALARKVLATFPDEIRQSAAPGVEMARDMTHQALAVMGPTVHMFSSYAQPFSADSPRSTFAIDVRDQEIVSNTMASLAAKAQGMLEPREFEGNQTYNMEFPPLMIGVGFNKLFLGNEAGVQSAMRLASRPDGASLSKEARFKDATRMLAPGAVMYSWADMDQEIRWLYWSTKNEGANFEKELTDMGIEPEERARFIKQYRENQPKWLEKLPPVETLVKHVGDMVSEMRATPDGFRGRILMVRPAGGGK